MSDSHEQFDRPERPAPAADRLEAPDDQGDELNWRLVIGVVVSAAVVAFLVIDGLGSETYFFTVDKVDEALEHGNAIQEQTIRVKGKVVEGSIEDYSDRVGRAFTISAKGETLRVEYDQAMPDTFKEGVQVVATGKLEDSETLVAEEVLVKCPSRYESRPPTADEKAGPRARR